MQEQAKQQLLQHGVQLEEFGGDVQAVEISALNVHTDEQMLSGLVFITKLPTFIKWTCLNLFVTT